MFSIVHPSYQRPHQAYDVYKQYKLMMCSTHKIEWIISLNHDELFSSDYYKLFEFCDDVTIIESNVSNMVAATNVAAMRTTFDYIILVSDDMYANNAWDVKLINAFAQYKDLPAIIQVHDGIRSDILTIPIMNRLAYEKLGYIYNPKYISMYADNDLMMVAKKQNMYYEHIDILFDHRHYTVGKSKLDYTYRRENSNIAFEHGKRLFHHRMKHLFED
jgi:hypothetical protein